MKFYEVQPALEAGKKIRRKTMLDNVLGISLSKCLRNVYVEVYTDESESIWEMNSHDLRADDWEIIGDSKTESKMDFSDALKALKEGKKIRRKTYDDGYWLEIKEMYISGCAGGKVKHLNYTNGNKYEYVTISITDILADNWDIFELPKQVPVKKKTVEYITCSNCGKDIELEKTWDAVRCKHCNSVMEIERPMTLEEAIAIFKEKYYSDIGELTSINFPCLRTDKGVQHGTIKVVSIDPFRTILEKKYSP